MAVIRFLLSVVMIGFPLVTLFIVWIKHQRRGAERASLKVVAASLFAALLAAVWGALVASSIEEYPTKSIFNSTILQMDIPRVVAAVTNFWSGAGAGTSIHPLVPLLFQPVAYIFLLVTGLESNFRLAQLTSILFLSLSAMLLFFTVHSYARKWGISAVVTLGYVISFGYLLLSSFPESSGLATYSVILPYAVYAVHRDQEFGRLEKALYIVVALISFGVTVTNIVHALIVYWVRLRHSRPEKSFQETLQSMAGYVATVLLIAVGLSIVQVHLLYKGSNYWFLPGGIVSQGAWLASWWDGWLHPFRVVLQVMLFAVVSPALRLSELGFQIEGLPLVQLSAEASRLTDLPLLGILALVAFLLMLLSALRCAYRTEHSYPVFAGLAFNLLLHTVYGNDLLLYVGYWLPLIWLLIALGMVTSRQVWALLGVVFLVAYHNSWGWARMRTYLSDTSVYAILQMPAGFPLEHEFRRTLIDWSGTFSPGIGSNGVLFLTYNVDERKSNLTSLAERNDVTHLLASDGSIAILSHAGTLSVEQRWIPVREGVVTYLSLRRQNAPTDSSVRVRIYLLVKSEGPAGSDFARNYEWRGSENTLAANGVPFIWCAVPPSFVLYHQKPQRLFEVAITGETKFPRTIKNILRSLKGDGEQPGRNVLLCWETSIQRGEEKTFWFYCAYNLPAVIGDGNELHKSANLPEYKPALQRLSQFSVEDVQQLQQQAKQFWLSLRKGYHLSLPDSEWGGGFWGATQHLIQSVQQDGRIPVTPINYGVFVRDAAYMVYALLVTGQYEYARQAIEYLLQHPWEGRPYPEGDTPGHLLWIMHKYWLFSRDTAWLKQKVPAIRNIAQAILDMRSDGMQDVEVNLLGQKRIIPANPRAARQSQKGSGRSRPFHLNYGTMDQGGILYVNLVSLLGLESARDMLRVVASEEADTLRPVLQEYLREFSSFLKTLGYDLGYDQRGYCFATWPARIHHLLPEVRKYFSRKGFSGATPVSPWKYLDMDYAHNFLVVGERTAGYEVIQRYLDVYTFKTWRLLDEGGPSSRGYWSELSNWRWNPEVAIPHGWSLASLVLLMRDALVYEDDDALILLAGVPPDWFAPGKWLSYSLPTEYGLMTVQMKCEARSILLHVEISQTPAKGIYLALADSSGERRVRLKTGRNIIPLQR